MAKFLYCLILVALAFCLGCFVGETTAPMSGITVRSLERRAAALEARSADLRTRYERLEDAAERLNCNDLLGVRVSARRDIARALGRETACPGCSH